MPCRRQPPSLESLSLLAVGEAFRKACLKAMLLLDQEEEGLAQEVSEMQMGKKSFSMTIPPLRLRRTMSLPPPSASSASASA